MARSVFSSSFTGWCLFYLLVLVNLHILHSRLLLAKGSRVSHVIKHAPLYGLGVVGYKYRYCPISAGRLFF